MDQERRTKILDAALSVFLRYGYRRVNMTDIATAAGVSRPALYLVFKNKEEIFGGVILQWVDGAVAEITRQMVKAKTPDDKLKLAFEIWSVRPFEMMTESAEAREIVDCSFEFAQPALRHGYERFEATIAPIVALLLRKSPAKKGLSAKRVAHVLANAVRGFKQAATTPEEVRLLIHELLFLTFR